MDHVATWRAGMLPNDAAPDDAAEIADEPELARRVAEARLPP